MLPHVLHGQTRFDLEQLEELLHLVAQTSARLGRAGVSRPPRATPPAHHAAAALRHAHTQLADGGDGGARDVGVRLCDILCNLVHDLGHGRLLGASAGYCRVGLPRAVGRARRLSPASPRR